ncbi:MAG: HlyD family efflux transporter periplasmic adaptor subunit [Synergistes sp.]|nr:HlyD family efflux transporter periplasmic adaptor subunit [Synergistes sp.]
MVRPYDPNDYNGTASKLIYFMCIVAIGFLWVWGYKSYFSSYKYLHPDVTWATAGVDTQLVKIDGVLLWRENIIKTPVSGTVHYPLGTGPLRVARGTVVAQIGGKTFKAQHQGYFVAGSDGFESKWRYSELWMQEWGKIPKINKIKIIKDKSQVTAGSIIGKLIEQPQDLRFIGVVKLRGDMAEQIKRKKMRVLLDKDDTPSYADVRVSMENNGNHKIYLTLPWFPPDYINSRSCRLMLDAGRVQGALVPRSAVTKKKGDVGVYLVRGTRVIFAPVEGKDTDDGKFIVTKGVFPGDTIVERAAEAREGRIQLW